MSPEQSNNIITQKMDVWAFGCVLLELYTSYPPYNHQSEFGVLGQHIKGITPLKYLKDAEIKDMPKNLRTILEQCFEMDYKKRPSADALLDNYF